jgi:3-keto-disaccharide hydrolase
MNRQSLISTTCAAVLAIAGMHGAFELGPTYGLAAQQAESACANVNRLSSAEQSAGWQLLFDGKSTAGWHGYNKQDIKAWAIDDCSLKTTGTQTNYGSDKRPDLVTDREYTDFELVVDWKASKGGNSGIIYGIVEDPKYEAPWMTGPEYQLLDDVGFPEKVAPYQKAGSNYGMQAPKEAIKILKPVGEWNTTRIVVRGAHVEHWLNGVKIVEFERWTPAWKAERAAGKWKEYPDYGLAKTGRIALQDHGSVFWFRNVKIRPLD